MKSIWLAASVIALAGSAPTLAQPVASNPRGTGTPTASDHVWLEPVRPTRNESHWYPRAIEDRWGAIIHLNASELNIRLDGDERSSRFAAKRVIWIEPAASTAAEQAALRAYADDEFGTAYTQLLDALHKRMPVWHQQWLAMLAARAAWRSGRSAQAIAIVSQLDAKPLPAIALAAMPVEWQRGQAQRDAPAVAKNKLQDASPAVRLVAASWLMASPERASAISVLKQLAVNEDRPLLGQLANAQLWRVATPPQVRQSVDDWQQKLDRLPMVLQTGPALALIEKFNSAGLSEPAKWLQRSVELTPIQPIR